MLMRGLAMAGALILVGCTATAGKPGHGQLAEVDLKCSGGWAECYRKASALCSDGYVEVDRSTPERAAPVRHDRPPDRLSLEDETFVRDVDERALTVRCR